MARPVWSGPGTFESVSQDSFTAIELAVCFQQVRLDVSRLRKAESCIPTPAFISRLFSKCIGQAKGSLCRISNIEDGRPGHAKVLAGRRQSEPVD